MLLRMANRITRAKLDTLYGAIGRFVLTWSEVETYLDLLVLKLRKSETKLPHLLADKIKFARKLLEPPNTSAARNVLSLLQEIEEFSNARHDYIHGARIGHSFRSSKLSVTLGRLLQPQWRQRRKPTKVTAAEIEEMTDRLYDLGGKLLDLLDGPFSR